MKIHLFMQSQSDDRKLASDDSHWSASAKNFVLTGQWKTEFSRRPFRTGSTFIWSARTSPRFGTGRHVAQSESGDTSPHSKLKHCIRTQSFGALFQPLRSWLISAVPSEQKSVFHPCSIPPMFHSGAASRGR
jgi:hypothetical protein